MSRTKKEDRVYVRFPDAASFRRVQKAAQIKGLSVSALLRMAALDVAREMGVE